MIRELRRKCPWDSKQTLNSLKSNLIEEAYEVIEAIGKNDFKNITEEIGDLLFLTLFLALIIEEKKRFKLKKLIKAVIKKYRDKHPHIFQNKRFKDAEEVVKFWHSKKDDIFSGIPNSLPALQAAKTIQERAGRFGFDWHSAKGPLKKAMEEIKELKKAKTKRKRFEEMGDLLFSCVNLSRHLGVDPEGALRRANKKFVKRFSAMQKGLKKMNKDIYSTSLSEMDRLWNQIKKKSPYL